MARDSNNEVSKPIRWQEMSDCFSRSGKHLFTGALSDALVLLMLAQRAVEVLVVATRSCSPGKWFAACRQCLLERGSIIEPLEDGRGRLER